MLLLPPECRWLASTVSTVQLSWRCCAACTMLTTRIWEWTCHVEGTCRIPSRQVCQTACLWWHCDLERSPTNWYACMHSHKTVLGAGCCADYLGALACVNIPPRVSCRHHLQTPTRISAFFVRACVCMHIYHVAHKASCHIWPSPKAACPFSASNVHFWLFLCGTCFVAIHAGHWPAFHNA
jgi:hypothetical protein